MIPPTSSAARRTIRERLDYLAVADPEAARRLGAHLTAADPRTCAPPLARIVDDVVEALALEVSFGRRLAEGMGRILAHGTPADLERYRGFVQAAAASGPTLGSLVACHFVPVLIHGDADLADRFAATTRVMLQKGTYTLKAPLETLSALIQADDRTCARAFLDLLAATYAQELSYNRTVYLTHTLPRAVDGFDRTRRLRLIRGLTRVIQEDDRLADDYIQGCAIGLQLLSEAALEDFLDQAIRCHRKDPERGGHFLSLGSHRARQVCRDLQITVPLASVRPALERYARARTGMAVPIRPLSALPATCFGEDDRSILVYCDGRSIHLPDEMGLMNRRADNIDLYKLLVKLEVGAIEFGTCELDADKALGDVTVGREGGAAGQRTDRSDLRRFLDGFADPEVALDLFTLFEHARLARNVKQRYPGLHCRLSAALDDRALQARAGCEPGGTLYPFYRRFVMDAPLTVDGALANVTEALCSRLAGIDGTATAAASARLAAACYPRLAALVESGRTSGWQPLRLPFGRRLHPDAFAPCDTAHHRLALDIQTRLAQRGIKVYRSDIRELLDRQDGRLTPADLRPVIVGAPAEAAAEDLAWLDLESLTRRHALEQSADLADGDQAYRYREWDGYAGDYLPDRVRVRERMI
ncbi:MAG TPA: hypothetical protein VLT88_00595, partial [Desulfosarcina sp.]|nr:hypothetical protein [Desulfosarcina sp.]